MPAAQVRQLRRRIRSVDSTRKITRAMELIATSRIVRAQQRVVAARPYAEELRRVVANVIAAGAPHHPLLRRREEIRRTGLVVVAADRGLAGAYNANVLRRAEAQGRVVGSGLRLFPVGRKAENHFRARGYEIERAYGGITDRPAFDDARRVAADVMTAYQAGTVDAVDLVFTQFFSLATQRVVVQRLLPIEAAGPSRRTGYELEPGETASVLDRLLPAHVEARIFDALLEASASEHAARQRAMKAATENAEDLVTTLTRTANRVRQSAITTELAEIVGGAEALGGSERGRPVRRKTE